MSPQFTLRTECRLCNSPELTKVVDFPHAVAGECLKPFPDDLDPEPIPIDFYQCEKCGHVQILHIPPLENLFNKEYSFMPSRNPRLLAHFDKTVAYFTTNFTDDVQFAFELGSNDGAFLAAIRKQTGCRVLGMDPALGPAEHARNAGIETIVDFFDESKAQEIAREYGQPDMVIANNVFAHNDNLRGMISGIATMLKDGGYFVFEVSSLKSVIEKYLIGTIIHEHLSVHSLYSLKPCLAEFGLHLVGVREVDDVQGGALVGVAQKRDEAPPAAEVDMVIEKEIEAGVTTPSGVRKFGSALAKKVTDLRSQIDAQVAGKVVGYGAARSAPFIIDVLGLGDRISCIIDDNPQKKGKFLPISNIPVVGSDEVEFDGAEAVFLILGWAQTERILDNLRSKYDSGKYIAIFPEFKIAEL